MRNSLKFKDFYFEKWTIQELKKFAKDKELGVPARSSKEEILNLIIQKLSEKEQKIELSYPAINNYINISSKKMKNQYFFTLIYGINLLISLILLILLINNIIVIKGNDFFDSENSYIYFLAFFLFSLFYFMQIFRNYYEKRKITTFSIKYFNDLRNYLLYNEKIRDPSALNLLRIESKHFKRNKYIQKKIFKEKIVLLNIISWMVFLWIFLVIIHYFLIILVIITYFLFMTESKINNLIKRIKIYVEFCFKEFIKEVNAFLKDYEINFEQINYNDCKLILNKMVDLLNYRIFGKDYEINDNYREYQTEVNLTQLLTLTYKFETKIFQNVLNIENMKNATEIRIIIEYTEKIRKMVEFELDILYKKSKKFKYYIILTQYILPTLTILGAIWTIIQIIQLFN